MKLRSHSPSGALIVGAWLALGVPVLATGCAEPDYRLTYEGPAPGAGDLVFPDTPTGHQVEQHLDVMAAVAEDAEERYQASLAALRANPEAASVLAEVYGQVPEGDYFRRTLLTEALKELRTPEALPYLRSIATSQIPEDRAPGDTEVNTREAEIVIRITAVQGLSNLAAESSAEADDLLLELVGHEELTVRKMAARGYLASPLGDPEQRLARLRELVPQEEHWYVTTKVTDPREVDHPEVLEDFDLDSFLEVRSDDAPKTEGSNR